MSLQKIKLNSLKNKIETKEEIKKEETADDKKLAGVVKNNKNKVKNGK